MSYEAVEAVYKIIWCYLGTTHTSALSLREKSAKYKVQVAPTDHHNKAKNISILIMNSKVLYFVSNRKSDFMIIIFCIFIFGS